MIGEIRLALRLLWVTGPLPLILGIVAALAALNVFSGVNAAYQSQAQFDRTVDAYAQAGDDLGAALREPAGVSESGGSMMVENTARFDYDQLAAALQSLLPFNAVDEALKFQALLVFPAALFVLALWLSTAPRRYGFEKVILVRAGVATTTASRQVTVAVAALLMSAIAVVVDLLGRTVAWAVVSRDIDFAAFPPLEELPEHNPLAQAAVVLAVALFFGWAGLAVGAATGVFIVPTIVFLAWDYVLPILVPHDPRNWFTVLAHGAFDFTSTFALRPALPVDTPIVIAAVAGIIVVLGAAVYPLAGLRNPRAQ